MTVSSTDDPRAGPFDGNGSQTAFPFEFKVFAKEDLLVVQADENGAETTLVLDSDYSVTLNADQNADPGGTVTAIDAPPTGETLTIVSNLDFTQESDITNMGGFYPEVVEQAIDRAVMLVKQVNEKVVRTLQLAVSAPYGVDVTLPVPEDGSVLGWVGQSLQNFPSVPDISVAQLVARLADDADEDNGPAMLAYLYSLAYAEGTLGAWMKRFVFVRDHGTDLAAFQAAIDRASAIGGATVMAEPGRNYTGTAIENKQNVYVRGNCCTINQTMGAGSVTGFRMATRSIVDGVIFTPTTGGSPSSQFFWHCPVTVGAPNNNGDSVASPNAYQTVTDWAIINCEITPCRQFGPMIQVMGDASRGLIRGNRQPSNSNGSGIHLDWGNVGTVSSSAISTTRASFDANQAYTTHPHDITIEDNHMGALSVVASGDLGSSVVRMSACHRITVRNNSAESTTLTGYRVVGGDLGYEFAPAAVKPYAMKGIALDGLTISAPTSSFLDAVWVDTTADNIDREQTSASAYVPLMSPLMHGSVTVSVDVSGPNVSSGYGIRLIQARGVKVKGGSFQKFDIGIYIDEYCQDIDVEENAVFANRSDGIKCGTTALRESTDRIGIRRNRVYGNGTAGTGYGIHIARGRWVDVEDNTLGTADESTQDVGVVVADNAVNYMVNVRNNHVHGATTAAYSIPGSVAPYYFDQIGEFNGNTADAGIPQAPIVVSQNFIPIKRASFFNKTVADYISNIVGDPSTGRWTRGSIIRVLDATSGAYVLKSCVTSGTFGTLSGLTNCATTNASNNVTMSLAATTATASAQSYSCVVASAANLRVGLICSIAGGVTNARIVGISGTTVELDRRIKAVTGAAFTTAGVIEGETVTINTGTPLVGTVMKINGTTVTLDAAATSSETGRTVGYVTPVFDAHQVI